MCSITGVGERLHKVLGQIDLGTLDSGERSLPFGLLVFKSFVFSESHAKLPWRKSVFLLFSWLLTKNVHEPHLFGLDYSKTD